MARRKCSRTTEQRVRTRTSILAELAESGAILAHRLAGILELGFERKGRWRFRPSLSVGDKEQRENGDRREKVGDHNRPGIARRKIASLDDVPGMPNAGSDEEARRGNPHRQPCLVTSERSIQRGKREAEIGDADLILKRARRPANRRGRLLGEKDMAEKRPKPQQSEREHEQVAEQPIDDEAAVDWPRPCHIATAAEANAASQSRIGTSVTCDTSAPYFLPAGFSSMASSSSIRPSMTLSPIDQKFGSEASRPNGASNSLW